MDRTAAFRVSISNPEAAGLMSRNAKPFIFTESNVLPMKNIILLCAVIFLAPGGVHGQDLLNKIKKKAADKANEVLGGKQPSGQSAPKSGGDSAPGGTPANTSGEGLVTTPPDVRANLGDATTAYQARKYSEARYAVQQAMLGVEMEIGNKILKSLPETISGLKREPTNDRVTSTGFGWAGLTIERTYHNGADKHFQVTIANNAVMMSAVNMYFSGGAYAQSTDGKQNMKQTRLKNNRAIIEFEEDNGYELTVPIGQSSLMVLRAVNFATEQEVMTAANAIDIEGIKKMLGEQ